MACTTFPSTTITQSRRYALAPANLFRRDWVNLFGPLVFELHLGGVMAAGVRLGACPMGSRIKARASGTGHPDTGAVLVYLLLVIPFPAAAGWVGIVIFLWSIFSVLSE
jgi:hypothetical protein